MFTDKIIPEAVKHGLHLITRVPDTYDFAKSFTEKRLKPTLSKYLRTRMISTTAAGAEL